jgi:biopolymer transport protein ExbD
VFGFTQAPTLLKNNIRMARQLGEINASSMADITFLLLIFFLVTTTMNIDTGLVRVLPPIPEKETKTEQQLNERNVFIVLINQSDKLLVEGAPMDVFMLREKAKEFIANPTNDPKLPEKHSVEVPFFGTMEVGKGVISLQNHRGTSYKMFMLVQNELVAAYNELRDELAKAKFGKAFNDISADQQDAVSKVYPFRISEAEPVQGGKK